MFSWLIFDRGILDRHLILLDMSRKEANDAHGPDCSRKQTEDPGRRQHKWWPRNDNSTDASVNRRGTLGRGEEADGVQKSMGPTWLGLIPTNTYTWKHLAWHVRLSPLLTHIALIWKCIFERISFHHSPLTTHHYISTRPPLFSGMWKISSSLTIKFLEISHSLTWCLEGSWPAPHWCFLFGSFCSYFLGTY